MTVKELMKKYNPNPNYEGYVTNDDYVLAINTGGESVKEEEYQHRRLYKKHKCQ